MKQDAAIAVMSALAQPTRLQVVLALIRAGEAGIRAGDIAAALQIPHNTMSAHLSVLSRAGLVDFTKDGRFATYRALAAPIAELSGFLAGLAVGA